MVYNNVACADQRGHAICPQNAETSLQMAANYSILTRKFEIFLENAEYFLSASLYFSKRGAY